MNEILKLFCGVIPAWLLTPAIAWCIFSGVRGGMVQDSKKRIWQISFGASLALSILMGIGLMICSDYLAGFALINLLELPLLALGVMVGSIVMRHRSKHNAEQHRKWSRAVRVSIILAGIMGAAWVVMLIVFAMEIAHM